MSNEAPRFRQARKARATAADDVAARCYADHYDIVRSDIYAVETLVHDVHDREAGYTTAQILDYGGTDRILDLGDRHIHLAQRFRPVSSGEDLPLRVETGVDGRPAELQKWQTAHQKRGHYPSVIAFGRWEGVLEAFERLVLLATPTILDGLAAGQLVGERHPTGDGTAARYLSLPALRDAGAVLAEFEQVFRDGGGL